MWQEKETTDPGASAEKKNSTSGWGGMRNR